MPNMDATPKSGDTVTAKTDRTLMRGEMEPQPRLRINKSDGLPLSTNWQRVVWNGTSARNQNSFPPNPDDSPNSFVYYDSSANLIKFKYPVDRSYLLNINASFSCSSLLSLGNLIPSSIQLRCVAGTTTFPLPDQDGYVDIEYTNLRSKINITPFTFPIYAASAIRDSGLAIEMRLSQAILLGTAKLEAADLLLYGF